MGLWGLILPEYIADSILDSVESASLSFLRLYAPTSLFLTYSNVNSSSSPASRAVIRVSHSSGRPHSNIVATCRSFTSSPTPRSCSTSRNTALMYSCMFWSSCNLILYSFFLKYIFATEIRSFVYLLKLFPYVLRTCAVADVNKLVVFNSQRYRTLSFSSFLCQSSGTGSCVSPCTTVHVSSRINNIFTLNFQIW